MAKSKKQAKAKKNKRSTVLRSLARSRIPLPKFKYILIFIILISAFLTWLLWGIPLPNKINNINAVSTKLYDRNGELIYEIFTEERRSPISLDELPDHVKNATLAIEDKDFYKHPGFSITGMARAAYKNLFKQKFEGGSTLTQQLVKNTLLTPERTIRRKLREVILATIVEIIFSKDEIFEMYLNQIPYGSTAYGIDSAAELYFGKKAVDLNLSEASLLAGLTAAPTRYSPFGAHPELATQRQRITLERMLKDNYITEQEKKSALAEKLVYAKPENLKAPHFALWVKDVLAQKYGDAVVEQGGLRVTTTLDLELQNFAQEAVKKEVDNLAKLDVRNGAALVTRPATGEILAMVGSKDYFAEDEDGKVNIIFAKRQPGSSIKPLNYALAIKDHKITAATILADVPTCFNVIGQKIYCPVNYDSEFHGGIQARFALGNSYNIPAVRVLALNGLENFVSFANELGISTFENPDNYGLSLTLGGGEVTPFDMATAFGVLANQGIKQPLISILKVEDWKGKILFEKNLEEEELLGDRVLNPDVTYIISHILLDNNARAQAFGTGSYLRIRSHPEVSVKTGTTNDLRDNWTIGYNSQILALTWVGNNDNSPMGSSVSGVSGASPIWNEILTHALDKAKDGEYSESEEGQDGWPQKPDNVIGKNICSNTGFLKTEDTADCPLRFEYFLEDNIPSQASFRQDINIDRTTQNLATKDTPPENIETQNHLVVSDPLGTVICLTCPFPMQQTTINYSPPVQESEQQP